MNPTVLFIVIVLQVLTFQFLAVEWTRVLPDYLVGRAALEESAAAAVRRFKQHAGRGRRALGAALLLMTALVAFANGDPGLRKLALTGISLVSAGALLGGYLRDRAYLAALACGVPEPSVRVASIEPRALRRHYAPGWEVLPFLIVFVTIISTVVAMMRGGGLHLVWLPVLQVGAVIGGFVVSIWYARSSRSLPQRVKAGLGDTQAALEIDARLTTLELKTFLAAKVGVVLVLALEQAAPVLVALGREPIGRLEWVGWFLVVALLGVFGWYIIMVSRIPKRRGLL